MINPFLEVRRWGWIVILNVIVETFETVLWLKIIQSVFEWILYVSPLEENLVVPACAMDIAVKQRDHVVHHLLVPREDDVRTAGVVGKALFLDGKAMASTARFLFEDLAFLFQMGGDADAGQPAAKYSYGQDFPPAGPLLLINRKSGEVL